MVCRYKFIPPPLVFSLFLLPHSVFSDFVISLLFVSSSSHLCVSFSVFERGRESGVTAAELTEQKIGLMLLEVCHKAGGSDYLRHIYHIIQGNEVGKHSLSPAIRWLLAWGRRLFRRGRHSEEGCCLCNVCLLWSSVVQVTSRVQTYSDFLCYKLTTCRGVGATWSYHIQRRALSERSEWESAEMRVFFLLF